MKKRIFAVILSVVVAAGAGMTGVYGAPGTNQDYSQDFSTAPAEWVITAESKNTQVENGELHFGTGDYNVTDGFVYLEGYTWDRFQHTLSFKVRNRQADAKGPIKAYFNYTPEAYYALAFYRNDHVALVKKTADTEETVLEESDGTFDLWNSKTFSVILKNGAIRVLQDSTEIITYNDSNPVQAGGIAFGAAGANGYIDDVSVTAPKINQNYQAAYTAEITAVPADWQTTGAVNMLNGHLHLGHNDQYNPGDGEVFLANYQWEGCRYSFHFFLSNRVDMNKNENSVMTAYFNYKDTDNYYAVQFPVEQKAVTLVKRVDGQETVLASVEKGVTNIFGGKEFTIWFDPAGRIALQNETDHNTVLSCTDSAPLLGGTVGFGASQSNGYINHVEIAVLSDGEKENEDYSERFPAAEMPAGWETENCTIDAGGQRLKLASWSAMNSMAVYTGHKWTNQNYIFSFDGTNEAADAGNKVNIYFNRSDFAGEINMYAIYWMGDGAIQLHKITNGADEMLAAADIPEYTGKGTRQHFKICCIDGRIAVAVNGSTLITYVDEMPVTGGNIGFGTTASVGYIDDIRVYTPAAAVMEFTALNEQMEKITSLDGMQGKTVTVQMQIEAEQDTVPVIGVFGGNVLYGAGMAQKEGDMYTCVIAIPTNTPDDAKMTVFLWSNLEAMTPYAEAEVYL